VLQSDRPPNPPPTHPREAHLPQEQVDRVLLLRVRVGVGVEPLYGGEHVPGLGGGLGPALAALEERRVRLAAPVLVVVRVMGVGWGLGC